MPGLPVADEEPGFGSNQLPLLIDDSKGARHLPKSMNFGRTASQRLLEQTAGDDIEPPHGLCQRIVARPFAELDGLIVE